MTDENRCTYSSCTLPRDEGCGDFCILHYGSPHKDVALFNRRLEEKIQHEENDPNVERVDLSNVIFSTVADFRGKEFKKSVTFAGVKFAKNVICSDTKFEGKADFDGVQFEDEANFMGADFKGVATFSDSKFASHAEFGEAKFRHLAQFRATEFAGGSYFWSVIFFREANFSGAKFAYWADFWKAEFQTEARFSGSRFANGADFNDAVLGKGADFTRAMIFEGASFISASFPIRNSSATVKFHNVLLRNADMIRFESVDLARVSFLRTDVSQFRFVGCTWPKVPHSRLWPLPWSFSLWKGERDVIRDELALYERKKEGGEIAQQDIHAVAEVYRQLRINYEVSRQEIEAGPFYVGQMDMRRLDPSFSVIPYRALLGIYRVVSMYGESYVRPFLWYLLFAPLFALGYWWLGTATYGDGVFAALTAGRLFTDIPTGIESWEKLLVYANMLADILLITLTVVALRRKFHR